MCGVIAAVLLALFGGIGYFTLIPPVGAESEAIFEQFKDDAAGCYLDISACSEKVSK